MLLYAALSSIVLMAFSGYLYVISDHRIQYDVESDIASVGLQVTQLIKSQVDSADSIVTPVAGTTSGTLTLEMSVPTNNPTIISETSGTLFFQRGSLPPESLVPEQLEITSFSITNLSVDDIEQSIKYEFTIRHKSANGHPNYDYEQTFTGAISTR